MFAILDVGMLAVRILAVVGGAAVGGIGTGWLIKIIAKPIAFKQLPTPLLRASRILGGLVLGLIVAAWVFNLGGTGGIGGSAGGWWPFGQSGGSGVSNVSGLTDSKTPSQPKVEPNAKIVRIIMRGGMEPEKNQRFYQVEGDDPRTWAELEKVLMERKKDTPSFVVEIVISKGSVDEQSEAVRELKNWAKKNSVPVK